jgi:hypothetical protein
VEAGGEMPGARNFRLTAGRNSEITRSKHIAFGLLEEAAMSWSWILGEFILILACSSLSLYLTLKNQKKR